MKLKKVVDNKHVELAIVWIHLPRWVTKCYVISVEFEEFELPQSLVQYVIFEL